MLDTPARGSSSASRSSRRRIMAQVENASEALGRWPSTTGLRLSTNGALFAAAAIWFTIGVPLTIEWADEGQIIYPICRPAAAEVAYRNFARAYWPVLCVVVPGLPLRAHHGRRSLPHLPSRLGGRHGKPVGHPGNTRSIAIPPIGSSQRQRSSTASGSSC